MPIRLRRKRSTLISLVLIFVVIYWINTSSNSTTDQANRLPDPRLKIVEKKPVENVVSSTKSVLTAPRPVREEVVEIDGKKLRKIDWHDYDSMAREDARTGRLSLQFVKIRWISVWWTGVGEKGAGVEPSARERDSSHFKRLYRENGFNGFHFG